MAMKPGRGQETLESPARNSFNITPDDVTEINEYEPRGIYVGGSGDITGQLYGDIADITLVAVPAGTLLPMRFQFIRATGTTATNLIGLY